MPLDDTLKQAQERKEAQIRKAQERILQELGYLASQEQDALKQALERLYVDWGNTFTAERRADLTEQLQPLGITVRSQNFTGDSSYPTEYTLNDASAAPTFDLALIAYIEQSAKLLHDLQEYINDLDERKHLQDHQLLKRITRLTGDK